MADVIWQDELDVERLNALTPYRVFDSGKTVEQVFSEVNASIYAGYGPDFRTNPTSWKLLVEPPVAYEMLLDELLKIEFLTFHPHCDLIGLEPEGGQILTNIRHDVDGDIVAALEQARAEAARGIRTTYFILHTAPYYGQFIDGVFQRNEAMREIYLEIQNLGHEVALHTDPMLIYQSHGMDGAAALVEELEWLREGGIKISGTVAHNSNAVYGANNYAIFKGRWCTDRIPAGPKGVIFNKQWAPLQMLVESELALEYEGNDISWKEHVVINQFTLFSQNFWFGSSAVPLETIDARSGRKCSVTTSPLVSSDMAPIVGLSKRACYLFLHIHPLIYGLRTSPEAGPTQRLRASSIAPNTQIGWTTCQPHSIEAEFSDEPDRQRFQSINMANELGFLDRPVSWTPAQPRDAKVLFIGRDNLHGRTLNLQAQLHSLVAEERLWQSEKTFRTWKMAAPEMGFARSLGWLDWAAREIRPDYVVLGIGADEIEVCDPVHWQALSGYDCAYPPGAYVWVDRTGKPQVTSASHKAEARREPTSGHARGTHSLTQADAGLRDQVAFMEALNGLRTSLTFVLERISEMGAQPVLLVEECGETVGLWSRSATNADRQQAHANFLSYLPAWLPRSDIPVVDPYTRFLELDQSGTPTHWDGISEWNEHGHMIAAELLLPHLGGSGERARWSQ